MHPLKESPLTNLGQNSSGGNDVAFMKARFTAAEAAARKANNNIASHAQEHHQQQQQQTEEDYVVVNVDTGVTTSPVPELAEEDSSRPSVNRTTASQHQTPLQQPFIGTSAAAGAAAVNDMLQISDHQQRQQGANTLYGSDSSLASPIPPPPAAAAMAPPPNRPPSSAAAASWLAAQNRAFLSTVSGTATTSPFPARPTATAASAMLTPSIAVMPMPSMTTREDSSSSSSYLGRSGPFGRQPSIGMSSTQGHRRISSSEGSYTILSMEAADMLQASWTNSTANPDDPLSFSSAAGFNTDGLPLPLSRLNSTASASSGTTLLSRANSYIPESDFNKDGVSSHIHDAARITQWQTVKDLCETDPQAAKYVGRDRWTALHHACNRRCPYADVVEALIRAYPDALTLEEEKGWFPLHYACRFKAPKAVVKLLVEMYPDKGLESVKRADRQGRVPLYYAVRYDAPDGVVGVLLNVDASVVLEEDENSDSPLALVWDMWAGKVDGKRALSRLYVPHDQVDSMTQEERVAYVEKRMQSQSKIVGKWKTVNMFLRAAFGFPADGGNYDSSKGKENVADCDKTTKESAASSAEKGRTWRILHAAAAIKCHPSLFQLALALHPEQAFEFDEMDLKGPSNIQGGWHSAAHLTALHLAASSLANGDTGKAVIHELLALNPDAASTADASGSLPLHLIVENKAKAHWTRDGACDIYQAYTRALKIADSEGRMPLHRAAGAIISQGESSDEATIARSILCNLLELDPDAASHSDNFGRTPLHCAVKHAISWDIQLQRLHDANPRAVRSRTGVKLGNMLPLHLAASNPKVAPSLISKLVELHPRGASQADRGGKLPLHMACEIGLSWESIQHIHEADTAAVRQAEQNSRGWNSLQMAAASKQADDELLSALVNLNPEAARVADARGRYALHLACLSGKKWNGGLSTLFDANPDALRCPDSLGLLPFHIASIRYCAGNDKADGADSSQQHHRRQSSRVSPEMVLKELAKEEEAAIQVDILFNLLRADPSVL